MSIAPDSQPSARSSKSGFAVLLTTSLVSSLIMLDSNIVAVSLPAIGRTLGGSFTSLEWVISAYLLSYASLLMGSGSIADLFGRKKAVLAGLVIFGAASAACGLAPSYLVLNVGRAIQGVGGSLLLTAALAILSHTYSGQERIEAFAFWGACLGIALTAGPIVGGTITNLWGWRWAFLVNLPACVLLVVASFLFIEESKDENACKLDLTGLLTFSPGLLALTWALIDGNEAGWRSISVLGRLGLSVALFTAFVFIELRQKRPMIDFSLFKSSTFVGSAFAMIGYGASAQVMIFFLPLFLQNAYGLNPAMAGLAMLPFALPMVIAPRIARKLSKRYSGRTLLAAGLGVVAIGNVLFWRFAATNQSYTSFLFAMLVVGTGAGILNGETVQVMQNAVPDGRAGMASGLASTTRFVGILIGTAAMGAILSGITHGQFASGAGSIGLTAEQISSASRRIASGDISGMLASLPAPVRARASTLAHETFSAGFGAIGILATSVAAVAALLVLRFVKTEDTAPALGEQSTSPAGE